MITRSHDTIVQLSKLVHLMLGCDELKEDQDGFYKRPEDGGYELVARWRLKADYRAMAADPNNTMKAALACIEDIANRCATGRIRDLEATAARHLKRVTELKEEVQKVQATLAVEVANAAKYRDFYELHRGAAK